ncbi:putative membrane protein [Erwinia phage pEa_SNUABM_50]|uniref:Putative membrane protein n=2 Tax=Eneladusvirus BF TaxID=2560751 RepID=A0A7L8ZPQ3_9CAUD|nr:putative membrane protein [Erwinia phage pEa_SNUABM_47]QOI72461.1 putative membrane protein [Erwinia phage pEa_SNUABM_50]QXO12135.1 hypothetical protein pEaSNUABM44_00450 [Erwinia phage pEa_SNUABM_44]QXO12689.1 hypothetical protein pEaSNUABM49_00454 [Erwinia phage pEa_SNUABM_49]
MKHFLEVLFVAIAILAGLLGHVGLAIWAGMFGVIMWFIIPNPTYQPQVPVVPKINGIEVEFKYRSDEEGKTFTIVVPNNGDEEIVNVVKYINNLTGTETSAERLEILSTRYLI